MNMNDAPQMAARSSTRPTYPRMPSGYRCERGLQNGVEAPFLGHALERVEPAVFELEAGADGEVLHRARDEDLARGGNREDALADVYGNTREATLERLDLPGVKAGADLDSQLPDRVA